MVISGTYILFGSFRYGYRYHTVRNFGVDVWTYFLVVYLYVSDLSNMYQSTVPYRTLFALSPVVWSAAADASHPSVLLMASALLLAALACAERIVYVAWCRKKEFIRQSGSH